MIKENEWEWLASKETSLLSRKNWKIQAIEFLGTWDMETESDVADDSHNIVEVHQPVTNETSIVNEVDINGLCSTNAWLLRQQIQQWLY